MLRLTLACLLLASPLYAFETFTDKQGREIQADFVSLNGEQVSLRTADGKTVTFTISLLSDASLKRVRELASAKIVSAESGEVTGEAKRLNELFGVPIFQDENLFDDSTEAVGKRLGWPQESKTVEMSSYRAYPNEDYRILGCRPYSVVLYGIEGQPERLSFVFANKGDAGESRSQVERAIEADATLIRGKLTEAFGKPERASMGRSKTMRERVDRWDTGQHAILLSEQEGEYVNVRIMPLELADNKGIGKRITERDLRDKLETYVVNEAHGDVVITNIPMVDQGPKGYCVPATFERYLRFMGLPADMYILAMAGNTGIGGGTSITAIIENIDRYVSNLGRGLKPIETELELRDITRYLDRGQPLIWTLYSSQRYNELANTRTLARREVSNWSQWGKRCQEENEQAPQQLSKDRRTGHVCLIVGYNKKTKELAVSDSWGPAYQLRWVALEQARAVSAGSFHVITF